ncbi:hypothetical protein [Microbacterium sp. XT11]|uniref:hypothetical protein n=1 Tax=Microbacterium sp. XT11 TaxID=367477 RepID=UPI000742FAB0|nr:hypothetical protein [Microbacterium sp. XT11]ALX67214.1 hypothetical protein AB663_002981 [Microbacterium sp. XT11]
MKTPIGTIEADYHFEEHDGVVTGTANGAGEAVTLTDLVTRDTPDGPRVTWRQQITRPLRLNLEYDVTTTGDTLTGESRAGRLPRTRVTGQRITA